MTRIHKHREKTITLATTGNLLELYGFRGAKVLEISSEETGSADYVYVATKRTIDGEALPTDHRAIPCSALPVELDVYGQGDGISLYASAPLDVAVVVR